MFYLHQTRPVRSVNFLLAILLFAGFYRLSGRDAHSGRFHPTHTERALKISAHEYFYGRVYLANHPYPVGAEISHYTRVFDADGCHLVAVFRP